VLVLEVLVAIAVLFTVGAIVAVRRRELAPAGRDAPDTRIPPTAMSMTPSDVDSLRFGLAFRGYRMDQVDDALDRLREELRLRDERLAALSDATDAPKSTPSRRTRTAKPPADKPADTPAEAPAAEAAAPVAAAVATAVAEPTSDNADGHAQPVVSDTTEVGEPVVAKPAGEKAAVAEPASGTPTESSKEEVAADPETAPAAEPSAARPKPVADLPTAPPQEPEQATGDTAVAADEAPGDEAADDSSADGLSKLRRGRHRREH
jgi:DivIVA domain-containing protein